MKQYKLLTKKPYLLWKQDIINEIAKEGWKVVCAIDENTLLFEKEKE